jgi:hypothetical protein
MKIKKSESKSRKQHDIVLEQLRAVFKEVGFQFEKFDREEGLIAIKHIKGRTKPHCYVAHEPDCVINSKVGDPENRIAIEYVHRARNFLFDLRGMIALSTVMKAKKFLLVINDNIFQQYELVGVNSKEKVNMMSLQTLVEGLNKIGSLFLTTL